MPDAIDWDDELLASPDEAPKAARTPLGERALEVLGRINDFVDRTGAAPVSAKGRSVVERLLANELAGLRAARADLPALAQADRYGLLVVEDVRATDADDPLLIADSDIFDVRESLAPKALPDYVADRRPCPDFPAFAPLFAAVRTDVAAGRRQPQPFHQEKVEVGEFFTLKSQLVHVADMRDPHRRNGKPDARLRVIFDNETESDLLMSSLLRRLYEDKDARRIGTLAAGPLFAGPPLTGARTGFVYVLRSRSTRPEVEGLLKVGTTAGRVEDRIARAKDQAAFLFAGVDIIETYELIGHSAKDAEARLHAMLTRYHVALRVTGPDGRTFQATEWFKVKADIVRAAVEALFPTMTS